jgi:ketosteroid isomerase-like protein
LTTNIDDVEAFAPFFRIIQKGLDGLVDGAHFFDLFADDAITEFVVTVPGYPKRIEGRDNLAELYRGSGDTIILDRCSDLAVHRDLEYAGHGRIVGTGRRYHNSFVSVITIIWALA